ncbi:MAG: DNA/RNA non-specific endonuclease [Bacteroidetes bacterium]|nr:DNA/RNA non-specific endonuclease [Bacteroidota bacterium]MDA1119831.1 DNA/RNA non-specific endonuclease [Bacteroidota bacterium]
MAKKIQKKRAPTRKKSTKNKPANSNWGLIVGLIGIILILFTIASYYYLKLPDSEVAKGNDSNDQPQSAQRLEKKGDARESAFEKEKTATLPGDDQLESATTNPNVPDYSGIDSFYFTNSFDFAWPAYTVDDQIIEHEGYTLSYDENNEQPYWVAEKLERSNLEQNKFNRKDDFREDPLVRTGSATLNDYKNSGYDRGHLAPAADFSWSKEALDQSFFLSNMSPQNPSFNRGIWKRLEENVRRWAISNNTIYVVTGPIIKKGLTRIGKNKVTVPEYYYKAILDIKEPELKAIAFIMKNEKSDGDIFKFAVTIDELEKFSGLDFFPSTPDALEDQLEKAISTNLWK